MANNDSSSYNLRWNEILGDLEYTSGLNWISTGVMAGGGITQLTGDVTAGPGTGSQAATIATLTHSLNLGSHAIINVTDPTNPQDAATKNYVDTTFLPLAGGTLTGSLQQTNNAGNTSESFNSDTGADFNFYDAAHSAIQAQIGHETTNNVIKWTNASTQVLKLFLDSMQMVLDSTSPGVIASVPSAILALNSTTLGFAPPRMTTTQKNAISSPTEGLMVYDLTLHKLSVWTGATWETVTSA